MSASVVALVRIVSWMGITMLVLAEMVIAASAMEPDANDVIRVVACPVSSSMSVGSTVCVRKLRHTDGVRTRADEAHGREDIPLQHAFLGVYGSDISTPPSVLLSNAHDVCCCGENGLDNAPNFRADPCFS